MLRTRISEALCRLALRLVIREGPLSISVGEQGAAGRLVTRGERNGKSPAPAMRFSSWATLRKVLLNPWLRLGEAWQAGECRMIEGDLCDFIARLFANERRLAANPLMRARMRRRRRRFLARQRYGVRQSRDNVHRHYDVGNDFYEVFLDDRMVYSCGFFEGAIDTLEDAQRCKIAHTLARAHVKDAKRVLEIGCGWGALTAAASEICAGEGSREIVGLTLSDQQRDYCVQRYGRTNKRLRFLLEDYRDHAKAHPQSYDSIVSVGMFEHVGIGQFEEYFRALAHMLKKGGRALVHSIIQPKPGVTNAWIERYIFPGGYIPAESEICDAVAAAANLRLDAVHHYPGFHYARTLRAWRERLLRNDARIPLRYDAYLRRSYVFYLAGAEASFRQKGLSVAQFALSRM